MPPKLREPEKEIQKSIVEILALNGWKCYEFARPGARPRCPKCNAWVGQVPTQPNGWVDILAIKPQRMRPPIVWAFEAKRVGESSTPDQLALHEELEGLGILTFEVHSVDEVLAALRTAGHEVRTR